MKFGISIQDIQGNTGHNNGKFVGHSTITNKVIIVQSFQNRCINATTKHFIWTYAKYEIKNALKKGYWLRKSLHLMISQGFHEFCTKFLQNSLNLIRAKTGSA